MGPIPETKCSLQRPVCCEVLSILHENVVHVPDFLNRLVPMKDVRSYCERCFLEKGFEEGFSFTPMKSSAGLFAEVCAGDPISALGNQFNSSLKGLVISNLQSVIYTRTKRSRVWVADGVGRPSNT